MSVPAALENSIRGDNAASVRAKIIGEAANGPLTPEADRILTAEGAFIIPDIVCNAGGVTVSYFEWVQDEQHLFWDAQDIYNRLEKVMKTSFVEVLKIHTERNQPMRVAANMLRVLDHPSVQVTKDNDGRPIALAAMHPEVAYNALATRIIEAHDRAVGNPE